MLLKNIFKIKEYKKGLKFSFLFVETAANLISGFILIVIGFSLFSNSSFQFNLYTKFRNMLFTSQKEQYKKISNIMGFAIDDEAELIKQEKNLSDYDLIGESIKIINNFARQNPDKKVVIGIDYVFSTYNSTKEFDQLIYEISSLNENVYIVLGGALFANGTLLNYFRYDVVWNNILTKASEEAGKDFIDKKIFIGNLHYLKSNVRSGFDNNEDIDISLGYYPMIMINQGMSFFSLPFLMYVIGDILNNDDLNKDNIKLADKTGIINFNEQVLDKYLIKKTKNKHFAFTNIFRYNFFTNNDLSSNSHLYKLNYLPLSRFSKSFCRMDINKLDINKYINLKLPFQLEVNEIEINNRSNTEYFIIYRTLGTGYLDNIKNDEIITPASRRNPFTKDYEPVSGAISHITALSNLINKEYIIDVPFTILFIVALFLSIIVMFITWHLEIKNALIIITAIILLFISFTFILFLNNIFFIYRLPVSSAILVFSFTSLFRFLYTVRNKKEV